jgi:hypothetical protein
MTNLLELPTELLVQIVQLIDAPMAFRNLAQTCRLMYYICDSQTKRKMIQFAKEVRDIDTDPDHLYEYSVLPNGDRIGEMKVWFYPPDTGPTPVLTSHYFISSDGSEVKAFWTTGCCKIFQEWYHNSIDTKMMEHKTYDPNGKLKEVLYNVRFELI